MADKNVRDELAELTEAVRELRDREVADQIRSLRAEIELLRAEKAVHHCHGCSCMHIHWNPYPQTYPATPFWYTQPTVTCGSSMVSSSENFTISTAGYTNTLTS